ncbi:hypothetical protein B0T10DRAFT_477735 [Thelonectria olida]|uniref:Uncharacterized protein n=1 Tax=Thelonectria olida TaxID=1576542 RepID=A0A9P8WB69_9HYPO|nr:hypothetical protein B0T10DRAFT_477735 [Thelonectria olida]
MRASKSPSPSRRTPSNLFVTNVMSENDLNPSWGPWSPLKRNAGLRKRLVSRDQQYTPSREGTPMPGRSPEDDSCSQVEEEDEEPETSQHDISEVEVEAEAEAAVEDGSEQESSDEESMEYTTSDGALIPGYAPPIFAPEEDDPDTSSSDDDGPDGESTDDLARDEEEEDRIEDESGGDEPEGSKAGKIEIEQDECDEFEQGEFDEIEQYEHDEFEHNESEEDEQTPDKEADEVETEDEEAEGEKSQDEESEDAEGEDVDVMEVESEESEEEVVPECTEVTSSESEEFEDAEGDDFEDNLEVIEGGSEESELREELLESQAEHQAGPRVPDKIDQVANKIRMAAQFLEDNPDVDEENAVTMLEYISEVIQEHSNILHDDAILPKVMNALADENVAELWFDLTRLLDMTEKLQRIIEWEGRWKQAPYKGKDGWAV